MTDHAYRVIQWATGGVGRAAIEGVLGHPELELVGCWVHSRAKDGVDVGALIGRDPIGVTATADVDALLALDADCVLYSPLLADPSIVAAHPRVRQERRHAARLVLSAAPTSVARSTRACRAGGVTLHGTGIHPGGITERFPLMLSALSGSVTHVRAEEFSDIRTYGAPDVVRDWMLFGTTPEEAAHQHHADAPRRPASGSPCGMVADELGFDLDPRSAHDPRDRGGDRADRLADRPDRARPGRRPALPRGRALVDGEPVDHRRGQLADGRGAPRPALDVRARGRAVRGRGHRRSRRARDFNGLHPESIEAGPRAQPRHRRHRHALRERDPLCVRRRARLRTYLDLPLGRRTRRAAWTRSGTADDPRPLPLGRKGRDRDRRREGHRPRHRPWVRRGRRRRRRRRSHTRPTSTRSRVTSKRWATRAAGRRRRDALGGSQHARRAHRERVRSARCARQQRRRHATAAGDGDIGGLLRNGVAVQRDARRSC